MDNIELNNPGVTIAVIPILDEQNVKLKEEIELAEDLASKAKAEYISKQQELDNFHNNSLHVMFLGFSHSYTYELDKATRLMQETKGEYEIADKNLNQLKSENNTATANLAQIKSLDTQYAAFLYNNLTLMPNILEIENKLENLAKQLNYTNDVFKTTNNIIIFAKDAKNKLTRELDQYTNTLTKVIIPIEAIYANSFYKIVSEANKSLVLLDSTISELKSIVDPNDMQYYVNFSQISSTMMLDTNFTSEFISNDMLSRLFKDYILKVEIILTKAIENYATLSVKKNELHTEISKQIISLESILISND